MVDLEQEADFIGKEALRQIKDEGVKRKLVGVEIGGERLGSYIDGTMIDFFPVSKNGGRIGKVTSACYSPRLDKNIGYAMLPIEFAELGTELAVETQREGPRRSSSESRSSIPRRRFRSRRSPRQPVPRTTRQAANAPRKSQFASSIRGGCPNLGSSFAAGSPAQSSPP